MTRTASLAILVLAALTACASSTGGPAEATSQALVAIQADGQPAENGKTLQAVFREQQRLPGYSLVKVEVSSGGSVSTSMFILRGLCAVMQARGERHGASEAVPGEPGSYRLRFPASPSPQEMQGPLKSTFSQQECDLLGFRR